MECIVTETYESPQHIFTWRNKKIINALLVEKKHLIWGYELLKKKILIQIEG